MNSKNVGITKVSEYYKRKKSTVLKTFRTPKSDNHRKWYKWMRFDVMSVLTNVIMVIVNNYFGLNCVQINNLSETRFHNRYNSETYFLRKVLYRKYNFLWNVFGWKRILSETDSRGNVFHWNIFFFLKQILSETYFRIDFWDFRRLNFTSQTRWYCSSHIE